MLPRAGAHRGVRRVLRHVDVDRRAGRAAGLLGAGNAFFIATALAVIVGAASGGQGPAILLYEAALGLGLSVGPLVGAALGNISWRAPFFGTATLMAVAFVLCLTMLDNDRATGEGRSSSRRCGPCGIAAC